MTSVWRIWHPSYGWTDNPFTNAVMSLFLFLNDTTAKTDNWWGLAFDQMLTEIAFLEWEQA